MEWPARSLLRFGTPYLVPLKVSTSILRPILILYTKLSGSDSLPEEEIEGPLNRLFKANGRNPVQKPFGILDAWLPVLNILVPAIHELNGASLHEIQYQLCDGTRAPNTRRREAVEPRSNPVERSDQSKL